MTFDIQAFGRDYRRFLLLSKALSHLPLSFAYKMAGAAGLFLSPLRWQKNRYQEAIVASGLQIADWKLLWHCYIVDHGAFCINVFRHETWDHHWFDHHVKMDRIALDKILVPGKGCLFLTYHHAFSHTLACLLGLIGLEVNPLVAPEESSIIYKQIGPFIRRLHRGCATHFNGGTYRFFNNPRQAIRATHEILMAGSVMISTPDFAIAGQVNEENTCYLFGRAILAPSGSIRIAQRLGTPIVAGITIRDGTSYHVVFRQLDGGLPTRDIMQAYFDFLAEILMENPSIWNGWDWFVDLPKIKLESENTLL
jgi:hypothetical protein